MSGPAAHRKV